MEELQTSFVVYVREDARHAEPAPRPEMIERAAVTCPTYDEAVKAREKLQRSGQTQRPAMPRSMLSSRLD